MKQFESYTLDEAIKKALDGAIPVGKSEIVTLDRALSRVVAQDIVAQKNLPSFDNSAMDGYAIKAKDGGKRLRIKTTIFAGDSVKPSLVDGECYKIMTGAQLPSDVDTVIPFEDVVESGEDFVVLPKNIKEGANFRKKAEEVAVGDVLLQKGKKLTAADIALLAAQGIVAVAVYKKVQVAILSTGDELKEPWESASEDEIYNANAFGLKALFESCGCEVSYVGSLADEKGCVESFIAQLKSYDVVVTTGGISMGEADFLYDAFVANGLEPFFHGVKIKPGRAVMMGKMGQSYVMALPGNPLTAMVVAYTLSVAVLRKICGESKSETTQLYAKFAQDLAFRPGRVNIVIGRVQDGEFFPINNNKIGSGMLTPLTQSNAIAYFGEDVSEVKRGELVKVVLI